MTEHEHSFDLLGTRVRLLVAAPPGDPLQARIVALRAHAVLKQLHATLTRFDPASELSHLNRNTGTTVTISPSLREGIIAAIRAARISHGLVDPTLLAELELAGYATSRTGMAPADLRAALATAPPRRPAHPHPARRWRTIQLDRAAGTVRVPAGVRLDLGGSAKGMAVDLASRMLARSPMFAVDAGGDIRLGGTRAAPRAVRVDHPLTGEAAYELAISTGAVATSGLRTRIWKTDNGYAHHIIDPATREPAWTGVIQATATAPTTLEAETLAKTALLLGPEHGHELLARHGGALILDNGELLLAGQLATTREPVLTR